MYFSRIDLIKSSIYVLKETQSKYGIWVEDIEIGHVEFSYNK